MLEEKAEEIWEDMLLYFDWARSMAMKLASSEACCCASERSKALIWFCSRLFWVVIEVVAAATNPPVPVRAVIRFTNRVATPWFASAGE